MGQGLGGTLPSIYSFILLLSIQSVSSGESVTYEGPAYFGIAVVISVVCYYLYTRLIEQDSKDFSVCLHADRMISSSHENILGNELTVRMTMDNELPEIQTEVNSSNALKSIENKTSHQVVYRLANAAGFNFLITLALFPSITTKIQSVTQDSFLSTYLVALHFLSTCTN